MTPSRQEKRLKFSKGGFQWYCSKSPRRQKRPHGYVCVTQKAAAELMTSETLLSWKQQGLHSHHAWVCILGPSLWARKVLSSSLSFLSLFPLHQKKKKKSFHLYCSVDIGLNDMLYAMEVTCQWNIEAAQGKIRGFFPLLGLFDR